MASGQQTEQVRQLRANGCTPKEIARALGLRPAVVAPLVRAIAAAEGVAREPAAIGFWINQGWCRGLSVTGDQQWPGAHDTAAEGGTAGLVTVVAAWENGGSRVSACVFLVDVWCLGVKDVIGPRSLDRRKLAGFVSQFFDAYGSEPLQVPADLVQHLVFGSVDYARGLGIDPADGFSACASYLGRWTGPSAIRFGCDGEPFYIQGPHDNVNRIAAALSAPASAGPA